MNIKAVKSTLVITCKAKHIDAIVICALQSGCRALSHLADKGKKVRIAGKNMITWPADKELFLSAFAELKIN